MSHFETSMAGHFLIRPATASDVAALHQLTVDAAGALERFDGTVDAAAAAIRCNELSLRESTEVDRRSYILLIEHLISHQVVGCIALTSRIGLDQPFYDYRLGKIVHSSQPLKSYRCLDVLYLCNDLTGCSEIHSLYVRPAYRKQGAATQLFKAVQMFIAAHPDNFAPRIIAELRGVVDASGTPPFWEAVGRHFFKVDQASAERMVAKGRKAFIAELMPKHPVYVTLLPESAQEAIGGAHTDLIGLVPLLEEDGFHYECHVDIFDGGRVIEGRTQALAGVTNSRVFNIKAGRLTDKLTDGKASADVDADADQWWLAAGSGSDFRMICQRASLTGDVLTVGPDGLSALGLPEPKAVRALRVGRPPRPTPSAQP